MENDESKIKEKSVQMRVECIVKSPLRRLSEKSDFSKNASQSIELKPELPNFQKYVDEKSENKVSLTRLNYYYVGAIFLFFKLLSFKLTTASISGFFRTYVGTV